MEFNADYNCLSKFSKSQLSELSKILALYAEGKFSDHFEESDVMAFKGGNGSIYLTNSEYQLIGINDDTEEDELELWLHTSYAGYEGFISTLAQMVIDSEIEHCEDIDHIYSYCDDDAKYNLLEGLMMTKDIDSTFVELIEEYDYIKDHVEHCFGEVFDDDDLEKAWSLVETGIECNVELAFQLYRGKQA